MKRILTALALMAALTAGATDFTGDWHGTLNVGGGGSLPLALHLTAAADGALSATLDSPTQAAMGIRCSAVTASDSALHLEVASIGAAYQGTLVDGKLAGTFTQNGFTLPLVLTRQQAVKQALAGLAFSEQEVEATNGDVTLRGTLALPQGAGPWPAVLLIAGSGPIDREGTVAGHQFFKSLADSLARHGIASLRYDKRGTGSSSAGTGLETTDDLAADARAMFATLRRQTGIDSTRTGLLGHSEGGSIAIINAAANPQVRFAVLLATPGVKGKDMMVKQNELIVTANGQAWTPALAADVEQIFTLIDTVANVQTLTAQLQAVAQRLPMLRRQMPVLTSPWYRHMVQSDPTASLQRIACPVLALSGEWDCQVDCEQNLGAIERLVKRVTVRRYGHMNHMMQRCRDRAQGLNCGAIAGDFDPKVIADIITFVQAQ